jgi:acetylornithine deacetylase/succinyl-diaminopimelate desuccinylase-like protein
MRYFYDVTLNVDGIWSGYTGEGVKTILPHIATAKMDSRLPMGVDPDTQLARIRSHLDAKGFPDVELRKLSGYPAAQTQVDASLVQAAMDVFSKWAAIEHVMPHIGGSAPFYQFTERLGLPLVFNGLGHGTGAHGPNEYMLIHPSEGSKVAGLADIEKSYVDLLFALAESAAETE